MKKYRILYDWVSTEISRLSDTEEAEQYSATLGPQRESTFVNLSEDLRGFIVDLTAAKASRSHFTQWAQLHQQISDFATNFPDFPDAKYRKLKTFFVLASTLSATGVALDEDEIDNQLFEIRPLSLQLPLQWLARENAAAFENSLVVFSSDNIVQFEQELQSSAGRITPKLVFHVLATLVHSQDLLQSPVALVKQSQPRISNEIVEAFVHLHVVAEGKTIHAPRNYNAPLQIGSFDGVDPTFEYQQWDEIFGVLSEYNSRTEPILKFLTIYHVVENLMIKRPLVELESRQNGRMFSLRSFQQMYEKVEKKELDALAKLFSSAFPVQLDATRTVGQSITTRWSNIQPLASDVNSALTDLGMNQTHANFMNSTSASSAFTGLVYRVRCAIVHNKETEFHLTHSTMTRGFIEILEQFLLPALEELCFALISKKNAFVWYQNQELKLY